MISDSTWRTIGLGLSCIIFVLNVILFVRIQKLPQVISVPVTVSIKPLEDVTSTNGVSVNSQDLCSPYQDYGYANGVVMVQRVLEEQRWFKSLCTDPETGFGCPNGYDPKATCESIVRQMSDDNLDKAIHEPFPIRIKK